MIPKLNGNIDRRGFLKCMEWAGAAVVWSVTSGVTSSQLLGAQKGKTKAADFLGINRNTLNKKVKDLGIEAVE